MGARAVPAPIAQLPNALTILRFALVPVFVVLLAGAEDGQSWAAAAVFAIAAITDQVDGWLARRLQVESQFGKYADPLADRLMIDVAVVMLFIDDRLPWAALVIIIGRDLLLVLGTRFALPRGYEFSVSFLGKLATWILYLGIGLVDRHGAGHRLAARDLLDRRRSRGRGRRVVRDRRLEVGEAMKASRSWREGRARGSGR